MFIAMAYVFLWIPWDIMYGNKHYYYFSNNRFIGQNYRKHKSERENVNQIITVKLPSTGAEDSTNLVD